MKRQRISKQRHASENARRSHARRTSPETLSDELFRVFVDSVKNCAIYTLDPEGRVTSWNEGAERMKGYSAAEIIGKNYSCFFTKEDQQSGKPEKLLKLVAREGRHEDESRRVRKDGSQFWAGTVLTAIKDSEGRLLGFAKVTRDITARMQREEELRRANAALAAEIRKRNDGERELESSERSLRELSLRLLRAQDEERRRIGRELHDSVAQYISLLKMQLEELDFSPSRKAGQIAAQVSQCVRLADDALREIRTVSHLLYPPALEEMGLRAAVPWYLEGFSRRSGIHTTLEMDADFPRLNLDIEMALFRVLQECLNNVHRHSGSNRAFIRLSMRQGRVTMQIGDAGRGIPTELLEQSNKDWLGAQGVGLRGMRERMRQLGGDLAIQSDTRGTEVRAQVPAEIRAAASGSN